MLLTGLKSILPLIVLGLLSSHAALAQVSATVASPGEAIAVRVTAEGGVPGFTVSYQGTDVITDGRLGLRFNGHHGLDAGFTIDEVVESTRDATWEQPWGERHIVRNHHNELLVRFTAEAPDRAFSVRIRAFDDGIGFRYEVPVQKGGRQMEIVDELTAFGVDQDATTWWIPSREWNRYEYLYETTPLREVTIAHTPITLRLPSGTHLSFHEAALVNYAGMSLKQNRPGVLEADLAPWSDGMKVRAAAPFVTPWRTVQIAADAKGLLNSDLILNLNEPNQLGDVSWVEPGKYIGIWWAMHIRDRSWGRDTIHGATTEEARRYIDFAAEHGFSGVLIEGWNIGWDGDWYNNGDLFDFTESFPDFDLKEVTDYALSKNVRLIGHHETSGDVTNYERQMADAFALYEAHGVRQVKTGYVADYGKIERTDAKGIDHYENHDGQFMVEHHIRVLKEAAKHKVSINAHEPVKDTGLRRTYPNWMSREGARGMEYNAWGVPPNPPEHTPILAFTRMLSGPMDYTPGVFDLRPNERPPLRPDMLRNDKRSRIETTLAKQLAHYVVIYSPVQMAADLPENYEENMEAFQFIKDVPADWAESIALDGAVGDYVVFARKDRNSEDWYLGAVTDEEARALDVPLGFLGADSSYKATLYTDGADAHFDTNPYPLDISERNVSAEETLTLRLAPGGGAAVRFTPAPN